MSSTLKNRQLISPPGLTFSQGLHTESLENRIGDFAAEPEIEGDFAGVVAQRFHIQHRMAAILAAALCAPVQCPSAAGWRFRASAPRRAGCSGRRGGALPARRRRVRRIQRFVTRPQPPRRMPGTRLAVRSTPWRPLWPRWRAGRGQKEWVSHNSLIMNRVLPKAFAPFGQPCAPFGQPFASRAGRAPLLGTLSPPGPALRLFRARFHLRGLALRLFLGDHAALFPDRAPVFAARLTARAARSPLFANLSAPRGSRVSARGRLFKRLAQNAGPPRGRGLRAG